MTDEPLPQRVAASASKAVIEGAMKVSDRAKWLADTVTNRWPGSGHNELETNDAASQIIEGTDVDDATLMVALDQEGLQDLPELDEILHEFGLPEKESVDVSDRKVKRFLIKMAARGLIKKPRLSLREYLGALTK